MDSNKPQTKRHGLLQFLKFNIVGLLNTGIDMAVFFALTGLGVGYILAQTLSYACGMLNSYLWNRNWTFRQAGGSAGNHPKSERKQIVRFIVLNGATLLLSIGLLYVLVTRMGMPAGLGKIVATACTLVVNFAGSRLWVFHSQKPAA
ncbi:GtrA family protein [Paenibacillus sp. MBLB4367]|uniref:GtrA family protein n=1 Tax=Paenibacillus sp. MBLB4367 TaxID=3384767 RepID=UPI0039083E9D